ncbi:transketolase [Syntrophotalea acetylenivorans]|uniref:Transketolase n=1 Tax=Syntrophotalea acetylenivorans TaxID=1842532 RepID=A0A1L3GQJ9_9BACT|nr:transketolase [Syntrophotalea acetylenivorans]APG28219.1 transketolase [Syntrophotalea acetylenivorans]
MISEQIDLSLAKEAVDTIRLLAADAVEQAQSGHPGTPMEAAPIAYLLYSRHLRHAPQQPDWPGRDRFILSCGHASALLYSLLHLTGYDLSLEEIKAFRQFDSRTPGHPEFGHTPGVETTTGPLGQGFAVGVGMAMGARFLKEQVDQELFDYRIYSLCSDGDLMEGVAAEAASLAGHLRLGNLVYLYLDNHITIEGDTALAFSEETATRFLAYGWQVLRVEGENLEEIDGAIACAKEDPRPSLIIARTHIGQGAPNKQDSSAAHGAPLGREELRLTKQALGRNPEQSFEVPKQVSEHMFAAVERGESLVREWQQKFESRQDDARSATWHQLAGKGLSDGWQQYLPVFDTDSGPMATRKASGLVLNALAPHLPLLLGGSADLAPSNNTALQNETAFRPGASGRNIHFGVREHAMGAILNGLAHTPGLIPYGGTFLIFSDYMRPPIRLAAMMGLAPIYVFTHDSIGLGEDGPTHQPVEQLAALRAIPELRVIRPADANETAMAWRVALAERQRPTALALSRQNLPVVDRKTHGAAEGVARGGYVLAAEEGLLQALLIASGSEVSLVLAAREILQQQGIATRVVSLPCWELFDEQSQDYRHEVLPPTCPARLAVEAAAAFGWERYVGDRGDILAMDGFGASAPADQLMEYFGFTVDQVIARVRQLIEKN